MQKYFVMNTDELDELDLPLHDVITNTHWTSPIAETFGMEKPTHLHFYVGYDEARKIWNEIKHLVPDTVVSVSFQGNK